MHSRTLKVPSSGEADVSLLLYTSIWANVEHTHTGKKKKKKTTKKLEKETETEIHLPT